MITVTVKFDSEGFQNEVNRAIEAGIRDVLDKTLAPIMPEILAEPTGKFIANSTSTGVNVIPEGFSPHLTEKIMELFK